jgi:hypothetical protein
MHFLSAGPMVCCDEAATFAHGECYSTMRKEEMLQRTKTFQQIEFGFVSWQMIRKLLNNKASKRYLI